MRHKKTIKLLKDYFSATDNDWMINQLEILQTEIDIDIITEKINLLNKKNHEGNRKFITDKRLRD